MKWKTVTYSWDDEVRYIRAEKHRVLFLRHVPVCKDGCETSECGRSCMGAVGRQQWPDALAVCRYVTNGIINATSAFAFCSDRLLGPSPTFRQANRAQDEDWALEQQLCPKESFEPRLWSVSEQRIVCSRKIKV